jgi:hypothetical protein
MEEEVLYLESMKRKLGPSKWNYRGFIVEKSNYSWIAKVLNDYTLVAKDKVEEILKLDEKTAKDLCFKIDKILGPSPNKRKYIKIPPKREKPIVAVINKKNLDIDDSKRIAYQFRQDMEKKYKELYPDGDVKIFVPVRKNEIDKLTFRLGWNFNYDFVNEVFENLKEKYSNKFELTLFVNEKKTDIEIKSMKTEQDEDDE